MVATNRMGSPPPQGPTQMLRPPYCNVVDAPEGVILHRDWKVFRV